MPSEWNFPEYPENWNEISRYVRIRDRYSCQDCGRTHTTLNVHHIVSLSKGGSNNFSNLKTLCVDCHSDYHPHMKSGYGGTWGGRFEDEEETYVAPDPEEIINYRKFEYRCLGEIQQLNEQLRNIQMDSSSISMTDKLVAIWWKILTKIKRPASCSNCGQNSKLEHYRGNWLCNTCMKNEIKKAVDEKNNRIRYIENVIQQKYTIMNNEKKRTYEEMERRYVVPIGVSIGSTEMQRILELERSSR